MITTGVVQIGNSDDRLPQAAWSAFIMATWSGVQLLAKTVHFEGYSNPTASWQNACWVFEIDDDDADHLRVELIGVAKRYRQDCIALTFGVTTMINSETPAITVTREEAE